MIKKKNKMLNKKGELTTQQLVVLIILIASFVVVLFFLFRLNLRDETNKEICHNSVVLLSKKGGLFSSLDCKTTYVCFSGGGNCENFNYDFKSEISLNKENSFELVKEVVQKEIEDCWWMFGEGKLDYVGGIDTPGYRCAICSTIEFDEKIQEKYPEIVFSSEVQIDTSEKYLIITGMDPKLPLLGQQYFYPKLVKSSEINLMNPSCKEFITKA